jgi:hypothetical protein
MLNAKNPRANTKRIFFIIKSFKVLKIRLYDLYKSFNKVQLKKLVVACVSTIPNLVKYLL